MLSHNLQALSIEDEECEDIYVEKLSDAELVEYARYGQVAILQELVTQGLYTRFGSLDERGSSMLHMFAANGHLDCIRYWLQNCPPEIKQRVVDQQNNEGNTALHWACIAGQLASVQLLFFSNATVGLENKAERTPLEEAFKHQRLNIVKFLEDSLESKSRLNSKTEDAANENTLDK